MYCDELGIGGYTIVIHFRLCFILTSGNSSDMRSVCARIADIRTVGCRSSFGLRLHAVWAKTFIFNYTAETSLMDDIIQKDIVRVLNAVIHNDDDLTLSCVPHSLRRQRTG